jgi:hypothetical protein
MVENRPWLTVFSHTVLILGIIVVAFPLYVTFVASTLTLDQILTVPMPLIPGDQLFHNYSQVLAAGSTKGLGRRRVDDAHEQPDHGAGNRDRQDHNLDHRVVRDRVFQVSAAQFLLLDDLRHADAAGRGAHHPDVQGRRRPGHAGLLPGSDAAADRISERRRSCSGSSS